jgi:hypothetical protein
MRAASLPAPRLARAAPARAPRRPFYDIVRLSLLWLAIYFSSIVLLDVLYNIFIILTLAVFAITGLKIDRANMPLIFFLVIYNIGGLSAFQPYTDFVWSREFVIGTAFVATTGIFYCFLMNEDALTRLQVIKSAYIIGAVQASVLGIIGYANIAGLGEVFSLYGRASGTFRDPNVFGPFLVLPALMLLWDLVHNGRHKIIKAGVLALIMVAILLSFSRGAWGSIVAGSLILLILAFVTSDSQRLRFRIIAGFIMAGVLVTIVLAIALSVDEVAKVFEDRFVLKKDYDSGPSGRFGNQLRSIPDLLTRPFGHGPNRFGLFYPENPHNVYLMAFSSYGWLGGVTFLAFIASTVFITIRTCFQRTPFQPWAIIVCAALIPHILQGFQIDTDRWRHLFLLYGLAWGLAAISRKWLILNAPRPAAPEARHRPLPAGSHAARA